MGRADLINEQSIAAREDLRNGREQVGASGESKMDEGLSTPYPQGKSLEGVRTLGGHQQLCAPRSRAGAAW